MGGFVASIVVGMLLWAPPQSSEVAEPVMVTPAVTHGNLSEAVNDRLETRLREVVRKSDLRLVEVSDDLGRRGAACKDDACRAAVIADAQVNFLLVPEITLDDQSYQLRLTLYGPRGSKTARLEESCDPCGLAEVADLMGDLGARIGRKVDVATRLSSIEVLSHPSGAAVWIDDELVGTTPVVLPIDAGSHALRVELDGYIGQTRDVDVVVGELRSLDLGLQRMPAGMAGADRRPALFAALGWTSVALGVGGVAGGAVLLGLDQKPIQSDCAGTNVDDNGTCRWRHSTLEGGIGLVAGGVVLLGTGIALVVIGNKRAKSSNSSRAARLRPRWGSLGFQF